MSRSLGTKPIDLLAQFTATLQFEDLPEDVVAKAKIHIADTLGAALAGTRSAEFRIAGAVATAAGETPVWGTKRYTSAHDAALLNGVAAHALELDDSGGCDHSGAVVLPAVMAAIGKVARPVSGKQLITAVVAGYDAGRRLLEAAGGYDAHNSLGWHSTATCGTFAAAAGASRLLGLDPLASRDAMTLSTSFSSGLWAFIHDGSQAKKIHAGRASEGGLLATELAAGGMTGPSRVFDDVWGGFFRTFNKDTCQPEKLSEDLGVDFKLRRAVLKPYASCRGAHSAIDALEDMLVETGRTPAQIRSIGLAMSPMLMGMCGARENGALAPTQMSLPYALAARCVHGSAGLESYTQERREDPRIVELMARMTLSVDEGMLPLDEPIVSVEFDDGFRIQRMVPRATGSAERPMPLASVAAKFRALAAMATDDTRADALWSMLTDLDQFDDVAELISRLSGDADNRATFR
ncbi:MmgE/PrpD family protein [Rhizobium deserti]|uniref:MmgE/PrpD family protein n=1 Tax=Rhizobium deserti TaxID=2547961 RepID=A0A4R5U9M7_9HYPH|nr:MmgE/PrpD family protein [Rhizobium deserti]TDK31301.1 MmgE/PrpD family protein [Rhizobium deserti]